MLKFTVLVLIFAMFTSGCSTASKSKGVSSVIELPRANWEESSAFSPLVDASESAQVVQLGESIHLTQEMPLIRIGAMKALNQQGQFDVLSIEGSAIDAWLAMDILLREKVTTQTIREAQRRAFFGLWQTYEMREVLNALVVSLKTDHPLYLTSFDSQIGMSVAWRNRDVLDHLADSLIAYGLKEKRSNLRKSLSPLKGLKFCFHTGFPESDIKAKSAEGAIVRLEAWIKSVSPQVEEKSAIHARALNLLPLNLRNNLSLCKTKKLADPKNPWRVYQEIRDKQNSENVIAIVERVSSNGKVMTWAHHSHVHYNSQGTAVPSMGQHLRKLLGDRVYTIGTFALGGEALFGQEEPSLQSLKDGPDFELNSVFRSLSSDDFFLDLKRLPKNDARYKIFFRLASVQTENKIVKTVLAEDFDGVIVLQKVSAPKIEF